MVIGGNLWYNQKTRRSHVLPILKRGTEVIVMTEQQGKRLFIYNPCAGTDRNRPPMHDLLTLLQRSLGVMEVHCTEYPGHAYELALAHGADCDTVVCCGGDGTLNEVVHGLQEIGASPRIGYIPAGSTNDMASNIGIPSDYRAAAALIADGHVNSYDIAAFNEQKFTYMAAFGPGVSVSFNTPQKMKNLLGHKAYMLNGFVFQLIPTLKQVKPRHVKITYDGGVIEDDFYFGAVSNALTASGIFKFNKSDVCFNDGRYEVMLVRRIESPLQAFSMLAKMRRRDYDGDTLLFFHASKLHFEFDEPLVWTLDGESSGEVRNVHLEVLPAAIRLFSPKGPCFLPDEEVALQQS